MVKNVIRHRWLFLLPLLVLACEQLPEGIGSNHEVLVLADDAQWQQFQGILRDIFERKVFTAQEENIFTVRRGRSEEFEFYQTWKNLVILATFDHQGPVVQLMEQFLSAEARDKVASGQAYLFTRRNLWAQDQEVFFLAARSESTLMEKLQENRDHLFDLMEGALNEKIVRFLYQRGRQIELEKRLFGDYGWTLMIPEGYVVAKELPEEHFVWLRRQQPHRWLFVHWQDTADVAMTPQVCMDERDRVGRQFYDGDQIVRERTGWEEVAFAGHRAVKLSGIWENKQLLAGGPFRTYCFYQEEAGRRYLVDAAVYAAGTEKEPYLRQVDLIVQTFSTSPLEDWAQR